MNKKVKKVQKEMEKNRRRKKNWFLLLYTVLLKLNILTLDNKPYKRHSTCIKIHNTSSEPLFYLWALKDTKKS